MNARERQSAADPGQILRRNGDLGVAWDGPIVGEICQMISENSARQEV